jgi:hypothetical protein
MISQLALFYAPVVVARRECVDCHRTIERTKRYCPACEAVRIADSKRNYRMGHSLFEDDYEIPYNAVQERYEMAEYLISDDPSNLFNPGARFPLDELIDMREDNTLPGETELEEVGTGQKTYLRML